MRIAAMSIIGGGAALLVGCGGGSRPDGEEGGRCLANGSCNPGLVCDDGRCVRSDGGDFPLPDAIVILDAGAFVCADDSALEPNDTLSSAFVTPVDSQQSSITIAGLAICPRGDEDVFRLEVTSAGSTISAVAQYEANGEPVLLQLVNAAGTVIANGLDVAPLTVDATVPGLAAGTYFVRVAAIGVLEGSNINNYRLSLTVSP